MKFFYEKIGREQARNRVEYVDAKTDGYLESESKELVTKSVSKGELNSLESRLLREMNIQLRWMSGLFVAIIIMFIGLYFKK